jgi:hypothetical protein
MAGLDINPVAMDAKLDRILAQISTMNKRLNSHDEHIARLEKLQQDKKVGATATPTATVTFNRSLIPVKATTSTVAFSRSLVPVKALEGDMAIDAASQDNVNDNQVAAPAGGAVQRLTPPAKAQAAMTPAVSSLASPSTPLALASRMQVITPAPTLAIMVPLSLPLPAAAPIPFHSLALQPSQAGPWLFAHMVSPSAPQQALQAPLVAWSMPPVQPHSVAPIAGVAARGGHHQLHV